MIAKSVHAILLDIEGTTTPIAFVTETLFPYARAHLPGYLASEQQTADAVATLARLRDECAAERNAGAAIPLWRDETPDARQASALTCAEWLMDRDRKSAALKELQGRVWEEGYERGELVGQIFADVRPALERWTREGIGVGIFSSGSVRAQQWLFRRSASGDLTPFLRWYFDTGVGPKQSADSYARIAPIVGAPAAHILFVSDIVGELDAARSSGFQTALSIRPGNATPQPHTHPVIRSFEEVRLSPH